MAGSFSLWLYAVSMVASARGGMLGMASGIFIVPILAMFGHIEIHTAVGASIVSVIACSCGGAAPFLKNRLTNIRLAIVLENGNDNGRFNRSVACGNRASVVSVSSIRRNPLSFRAPDAG